MKITEEKIDKYAINIYYGFFVVLFAITGWIGIESICMRQPEATLLAIIAYTQLCKMK